MRESVRGRQSFKPPCADYSLPEMNISIVISIPFNSFLRRRQICCCLFAADYSLPEMNIFIVISIPFCGAARYAAVFSLRKNSMSFRGALPYRGSGCAHFPALRPCLQKILGRFRRKTCILPLSMVSCSGYKGRSSAGGGEISRGIVLKTCMNAYKTGGKYLWILSRN